LRTRDSACANQHDQTNAITEDVVRHLFPKPILVTGFAHRRVSASQGGEYTKAALQNRNQKNVRSHICDLRFSYAKRAANTCGAKSAFFGQYLSKTDALYGATGLPTWKYRALLLRPNKLFA
jgi:hypothetical protein